MPEGLYVYMQFVKTDVICRAIHTEANALLNCSREQTLGAALYLAGINPMDALETKF